LRKDVSLFHFIVHLTVLHQSGKNAQNYDFY